MKPMSLNLSKMVKVAGDAHSSTFRHPSGHHMVIAHSGVSALQRKQLEKMPVQKFADGGEAQNGDDINYDKLIPQENAENAPYGTPPAAPPMDQPAQDRVPAGDDAQPQEDPSAQPQPAPPTAAPTPAAVSAGSAVDFGKAYNQGQQAISEQQKIDSAKSQAGVDIQKKDLADREMLNKTFQDNQAAIMAHQQQFMKDYAADHIDPRHYQESMTSGQKIATGIGLFLGGFGSAFTHQGNPAMEMLNKQIDRDIQAQMAKKDQQKTLFGANQAMFHDQVLASNQTRMNMNDIYDHKIQLAASQLGTQQAQQAAMAAHSRFAMENASLLQQNAMRATVLDHINKGGGGLTAMDLANAGMIPATEAAKEQASIDAQKMAISKTNELYGALNKEQSAGNLLNPQSARRVAALNSELVNAVMNASASKRLTHESIKAEIEPLEIKTTDDAATREMKKQGILNIIQRHADPTPYMTEKAPQSLPNYGQSAPQIKIVGGIKYMRGPDGKAVRVK